MGLAGAAPSDGFSKVGTTLSLRSEGAVISTTATSESRGQHRSLATVSACRRSRRVIYHHSINQERTTMSGKPFQVGGVINLANGEATKDIQLPKIAKDRLFVVEFVGVNGFVQQNQTLFCLA